VKRLIPTLSAFLFLALALPVLAFDSNAEARNDAPRAASARRPVIIDEVIRMSQAGVGDDAIIAYLRRYRDRFDINADDLIALNDAHVSKDVVKAMVDLSADDSRARDDRREPARYSVGVYYDPWYSRGFYYDPFWYGFGPRFSLGLRIGPRFGGHFGHFHRRH